MSGIVGIFGLDGQPVNHATLQQMLVRLAHRGPDGEGMWCEGAVGLGHLMLWTTPESLQEKLPLANQPFVLTADARIDNRSQLIAKLALTERPAAQITDSQLILAAYQKWGERCPEELLGDFAFALWDARRQRLFCARDHMGIKPFYYYHSRQVFVFASEIKALWCLSEVPRRVNEVRVADFLLPLADDQVNTFYQDIWRLPPGHCLSVTREGIRLRSYWALDLEREVRLPSDEAYAERFRELFTEAVRCRLRTVYPVGSVLSGGLDSSCVTCVAREIMAEHIVPLHTLSAFFTGEHDTDERPFIDAILAQGGLRSHRIDGNQLKLTTAEWEQILWQIETPFWYPFLLVLWRLYGYARTEGVRVLIDGNDGDSTVAACRDAYLSELVRTGRWWTFATQIDGWIRRGNPPGWKYPIRYLRYTWVYGLKPLLLSPMQRWGRWRGHKKNESGLPKVINPDLAQRVNLIGRLKAQGGHLLAPTQTAREAHYRFLTYNSFPFHMEMLNKAASAFSLEYRHPFFDKRLVEFCLALPAGQKFDKGQTRAVMRRALRPLLPDSIYQRPDKGRLSYHYVRTLLTTGPKPLAEVILNEVDGLDRYVDMPFTQNLYHRHLTLRQIPGVMVWYTAILALWLQSTDLTAVKRKEGDIGR